MNSERILRVEDCQDEKKTDLEPQMQNQNQTDAKQCLDEGVD